MNNIKGMLLDLDNTFYPYEECHAAAFNNVFKTLESHKIISDRSKYKEAYKKAQKRLKTTTKNQAASHNRVLYFQLLLEDLNIFSPKLVLELYEAYWGSFLNKMQLFPYFKLMISIAREKNIKIVIVTDLTAYIQNRKILKLGLIDEIDYMVTSEEAGAEKPTPIMFELALKKIGLSATDVIFIGDNFNKDIEGAHNLGITPYWFKPDEDIKLKKVDYYRVFSNYKDLIDELF